MRVLIAVACVIIPSLSFAQDESDLEWLEQCRREQWKSNQERVCEIQVRSIEARDLLRVRPPSNGGVQVIADDRQDIEVHVRMQASAPDRNDAQQTLNSVRTQLGSTLTVDGPSPRGNSSWSASFYIYVPRNTNLDLATHNGPVSVKDVVAHMDLTAQNGPVSLSGVGGDVRARTQNGPISIRLTGSRWNGSRLDAETTNGPLSLIIPENYNAELEVGTRNGPLEHDFPLTTAAGRSNGRHFVTTLGRGGAPLKVLTMNGPLSIRRRR